MRLALELLLRLSGAALLSGCAGVTQSASSVPRKGPDCSFRSATTCWTLAGRFSPARAAKPDSARKQLLEPPTPVLATRADSLPPPR
jgi:hypothetical protein